MSMDPQDLPPLLQAVLRQDGEALRRLYDATASRLLAIALRVLEDRGAAEDVLQEVFLQIWQRPQSVPQPCAQPLAWLTTAVRHRAIDAARRRRPEQPLQWQGEDGEEHSVDLADDTPAPPEQLEQRQDDLRLTECLARLAEEPRRAVMLAYFEGLTHQEIAERMLRPLGTVKAWVRRSLQGLQTCLQGAA